jgi:hypothetical protein
VIGRAVALVGVVVVVGAMGAGCKKKSAATAAAAAADAAIAETGTGMGTGTDTGTGMVPQTIVLEEVEVRLHGAAEGALVSRELARELGRCLMDGETIVALAQQVPPGREPRAARMQLEVAAQPPSRGEHKVTVVMDAQLVWVRGSDPAPSATVTGDATPTGAVDTAVLAVVDRLRDGVCADLSTRIRVWAADDLVPYLRGDDLAAAHWALVLVAERGPTPGVADAVIPHLRGELPLRDAAITALVALRDPAAVPALTELTDLADKAALTTIVEAVIAIGGDDARDYLSVMSSHRDPTIAQHARDGLARLDKRAAPTP